ncbi:EscU/YscU/HrcU family type III secretion system export apparatus switch protein [Natroniella sulfidigena]|uniref:EscU/YscU/HrcU family type III secretion system export apparatus switch protein n=1 Tax=Natroniella sulfidigena TaxID=723921 RepID=UPI00200A26BC|nr:EscU/YscU/HrcU family type III secretion system export apparatus switch protein [Natroniella sulfidigena]MCK8817806.1 EscU/YscU/HrcU family type III secretion system export apparatus switch protein [Natroniella sulfidigena]
MSSNQKNSSEEKEAVALKYDPQQDSAPTLIAKGRKDLAQQIIKQAKEADIPITEDQDLVKILLQLNLGEEIPEELYRVVAEILSFIYDLEDLA